MVDAILDSSEYVESFGDNIVPYERYSTPAGIASKNLRPGAQQLKIQKSLRSNNLTKEKFIALGKVNENRSHNSIIKRINQGVSERRDQQVIFKVKDSSSISDRFQILRAIYRQIFERDLNTFDIGDSFYNIEKAFLAQEITVQKCVEILGSSTLYCKEFYQPYPNTKVIELGTKHFLGRAPNNQAEIRYYNQILASQGLLAFITNLVNSEEYNSIFGTNTVPYRRFPTLPAANFPNTERLYNTFTKQNELIVIPSFQAIIGNQ